MLFAGLVTTLGVVLEAIGLTILAVTLPERALDLVNRMEISSNEITIGGLGSALSTGISAFLGLQVLLLLLPVIFLFSLILPLLGAGLVHVLLVLTRTPRRHGFRCTWIVACYAAGANLLGAVPVAGDILGIICNAALFAIGLHILQGVSARRAAMFASIAPLLLLLSFLLGGMNIAFSSN